MGPGLAPRAPHTSQAMARTFPLLRREAESATIHASLVEESEVRGVVVAGEAGVGKTTLVRACAESLPYRVQWVAGTQSTRSIPLGAFAHLLEPTPLRDPMALLATATKALLSRRDCVLCVDDAHLLDGISATLLYQLAIEGSARIIVIVRSGEKVPDAITSLWKDGYLHRLNLSPFTKGQCVWLIEQALGGRVEDLSADAMWEASGGNALFVRHLVEGALEGGALRQVRDVWQLRGRAGVTSELASLLDARIEQLPTDVLHTLQLLAFCEPLDIDTLTGMVGVEAVDHAESRGLIRVVEEQDKFYVRFTHPLFGEAIHRRLGLTAARHVRGELVRALRNQPLGPGQRIRLAELTLASAEPPDAALLLAAAQDAIALTDVALGARLAHAAAVHGGGLAASVLSARALFWQGNAAACEETLSRYNPDLMTDDELLAWGGVRIPNLQWSIGETVGAHDILKLMRGRITHHAGRLFLDGLAAMMAIGEGDLDQAHMLSEAILADPPGCPQTIDRAVISGTIALTLMGRFDQAAAVAAHGRQIDHADELHGHFRVLGEIWGLVFAGSFDEAEQRSSHAAQKSAPGQSLGWAMVNVLIGTVEVARGRFRAAVSRLEQAVAVFVATSTAEWNAFARLLLTQSYCALGEVEVGTKSLAELRTCLGPGLAALEPQFRLTEAWLAAAQGQVTAAVALSVDAADMARGSGQRAIELRALHDAIRFGDRVSLARAMDVASAMGGRLAAVYAAHAAALARQNPAAVNDAAAQFEQIGALLSAADAAAQATLLWDAAGDRRRSAKAASAAERLAAACGGIKTPALLLVGHPLPLSTREREIANLVAQGLSNREIAERLVVSIRTVEGHIYRACTKGGLRDREELAALVRDSRRH